jgi:Arc/MetJ family transcription regulator
MRTTLNLDDRLLAELMRVTEAKTKTAAIQQAMADLVRRKKLDKLKSLSGKIRLRLN